MTNISISKPARKQYDVVRIRSFSLTDKMRQGRQVTGLLIVSHKANSNLGPAEATHFEPGGPWCEIKEVGEDGVASRLVPVEELFAGRHFDAEIVVLCVRWYLSFKLSYRDLVSMMSERGIRLAHTTILRWVQHYTPEFEKRWQRYARPVGGSWRMDETYLANVNRSKRAQAEAEMLRERLLYQLNRRAVSIFCR
jgi:hypothetical protein